MGIGGFAQKGRIFFVKIAQLTFFENSGIIDHCRPAQMTKKMQRVLKTLCTFLHGFIPSFITDKKVDCKEKY